ncbi:ATPase, T2SS/T4P/T4SS family [Paraburkholderia sp. J8-2]|uniref:ATPase, T2SS/T4P/T4SS family n=1 Tax=Paraburkholderia sp. J8-2 TaxID=2805440 RepID=UPI002AB5EAE2|nr:ATPase, T2SS/T4P/T4SS family [Paraburkholderia sp. J8-2]
MSDFGRLFTGKAARLTPSAPAGGASLLSKDEDDVVRLPAAPATIASDVFCTSRIKRFGSTAIDLGFISEELLQRALNEQAERKAKGRGLAIGELCVELGFLDREKLEKIASTRVVEVNFDARLKGSPALMTWIQDIRRLGLSVKQTEKTPGEIAKLREARFGGSEEDQEDIQGLGTLMEGRDLFIEAAKMGANDVSILVGEKEAIVQIRVNGGYMDVREFSMKHEDGRRFARAIYTGISTEKDSYNEDEFQHAQIHGGKVFPGSGLSSIRIFRGPKYPFNGCTFISARLQYDPDKKRDDGTAVKSRLKLSVPEAPGGSFEIPGYFPLQYGLADELLRLPSGIVLVSGPTNSGKTTSLYSKMKHQARLFPTRRQVTIEQPPEYPQHWAIQLAADNKNPMELMVGHTLRMDPDIILIGEIRFAQEALGAVQAAQTGQFVWATMHVNSGYESISRMTALDHERLNPDLICNSSLIAGFVSQRLVGCLCPTCKKPLEEVKDALPDFMLRRLKSWGTPAQIAAVKVKHKARAGEEPCATCGGQGIKGQIAVAEIVLTTEELMDNIREMGPQKAARAHRMRAGSDRSLLGNGLEHVFAGEVDPADLHMDVARIVEKAEGM